MKYLFTGLIFLLCSCSNEKIIQLPEIPNSNITEVLDVSAAYIFYNEALADSVELNRKNLIITTNWLVNVDKRLTLNQAIPKIKFLQDKKRNAEMHKNEAAKNYFTCHDTSINNLGFIDFTDIIYEYNIQSNDFHQILSSHNIISPKDELEKPSASYSINYFGDHMIYMTQDKFKIEELQSRIIELSKNPKFNKVDLKLYFSKALAFQDYITFKSLILELELDNITIDNNEFIY